MRDLNQWLHDYAQGHQDPFNIKVHKICVPLITFSLFGILWNIKIPIYQEAEISLLLFVISGALIFYKKLGDKPFLIMSVMSVLFLGIIFFLEYYIPLLPICLVLFIIGWIFQYIGHRIEGKKPSFLEDIKFLLIGPLWVWMKLFKLNS